ncbi:hypothetical protein [Actinomadura bangladeshensis]|uniref:Uncharacterized protein n=1 Tax=Actinomadura bangladeshensis TaxID=453573 RepID=A0A6L9QAJ3_9ACTN|nr:hypothetical protein [Actinomadura bangladeshensis]NEA21549.1 hypothetical protein [Actinomadura bangladeshensis]NEA22509.1 hypothetical protein [Actinomadura bangladeshensis]
MWVAKVSDGEQDVATYGPFKNEAEGARFARFLTEEVDPARVEYSDYAPGEVSSPVAELLAWRDSLKVRPGERDARIREVHARLVEEAANGDGRDRVGLSKAAMYLAEAWYGHKPADPYAPLDGA